ncbi:MULTISPECIES: P-loop NTPase family protein [Lacticaseibacillus]|nr:MULTISPECIES: topology modulation protein [Lacticaseibacillus]
MKVMLIGNGGTGKSTFGKALAKQTGWPLLTLDSIWHPNDQSAAAKAKFRADQRAFMAEHKDWIIDGNYSSSIEVRLAEAELIVWFRAPRWVSEARVLRRSLKHGKPLPGQTAGFHEHFDHSYWHLLRAIWQYDNRAEQHVSPKLHHLKNGQRVIMVRNAMDEEILLKALTEGAK